jgi:predicted AAA+ superfamily ATPase
MIMREQYLTKIRPFIGQDIIKVLTGVRRSGKSTLLEQIRDEIASPNTIYLNFEDLDNEHLCEYAKFHKHISTIIGNSKKKHHLFFDEIQEVEGWEKAVNSLRAKFDTDIYLTGSNSKLLSGELATHIAGRYVTFTIFPFSYREYIEAHKDGSFDDYLVLGGMPFLSKLSFEPESSRSYLQDLFNSVVLKDIVKRNNIRDVDLLERVLYYALSHVGKQFSATSISKYFKSENRIVATETILNYLKACEEAFLLYRLKCKDVQGKKLLKVSGKYYVVDQGLREAAVGENLKNLEIVLENVVALDLMRQGYDVQVGRIAEQEIDFVATREEDTLYVQVCYLLNDEATIKREFDSLLKVKDNHPKIVLYKEGIFSGNYKGIPALKIEEWLLHKQ